MLVDQVGEPVLERHSRPVGDQDLVVHCSSGLAESAAWLLSVLAGYPGLADGTTVQLGWSVLTMRGRDGELWVCEPDFGSDPSTRVRPDVTITLLVLAQQRDVLIRAGVGEPSPLTFTDTVLLLRDVLEQHSVVAQHKWDRDGTDSGWYVGPADADGDAPDDPAAYEKRYVHELLDVRPELLSALALPVGFLAFFDGDQLVAVVDADDELVWEADE